MASQKRILIVDDEPGIRTMLATLLVRRGYAVLEAANAESAIAQARSLSIDAFLLDIQMPGRGGVSLCRTLRQMLEYRLTPIIFITGLQESSTLDEAFAAGADDYVGKPIDTVILLARLKAHLQRLDYFDELDRTRRMLHRYLSTRTREVVEASTKTGELAAPEHREVVILFTDIRGFTALAEQMDPNELFHNISSQLSDQVNLVYEYGGYIDKFGGDGVMAVFDKPDKALQACQCALHMIEKAQNASTTEDERMRQLGIGIHQGTAVIGNIGSADHMDYSAIGTTVNLAARLCGHAKGLSIVVSDALRSAAGDEPTLEFHAERQVEIRGLKDFVRVFNLGRTASRMATNG